MGYYQAGDYYRGGGYYRAGSVGSFLRGVGSFMSNPVGTIAGLAIDALTPAPPVPPTTLPAVQGRGPAAAAGSGTVQVPTKKQLAHGVTKVGVSPKGTVGVAFRKGRRMNAGNARAARRAIRRIKGVRHLLQSIERELPHRPARQVRGGSAGVITRGEAMRALRA